MMMVTKMYIVGTEFRFKNHEFNFYSFKTFDDSGILNWIVMVLKCFIFLLSEFFGNSNFCLKSIFE